MEKLKSLIPGDLKRMIGESTPENLTSTCSSLLDFFLPLPEFQRVIGELTDTELGLCRKSKESALDLKHKGNECFSKGDYVKALNFYSQALRYAPMDAEDNGKNLVALLYVNRASSMHNAGLLDESLRDCDRAIAIMPAYVKVHQNAKELLSKSTLMFDELRLVCEDDHARAIDEPLLAVLQCVSTPSKGRGMTSVDDIAPASLIHSEEPLAAIMNKSCRETHCHFCFIEVPADVVYCPSCTIPVFCSQLCQEQARGAYIKKKQDNSSWKNVPVDLVNHVMDTISLSNVKSDLQDINYQSIAEHKHECGGSPWSVVLPTDVVLAGRILAKLMEKRRLSGETSKPVELGLAHNYLQIPPKTKLEVHVYAVVLSCCLKHHYGSDYPITGASVSQLVILLSQVKVNSMAVVRMKSFDGHGAFKKSLSHSGSENAFTCSVEQVRVGQALYSTGSFFNHSCQPNVHAYFLSRKLYLRTTEYVHAGYPLEISYGPQVGQWDLHKRQELLEEQYSFKCQCTGCSQLNFSDLVLNAFKCTKSNCPGAVTEKTCFDILKDDTVQISNAYSSFKLSLPVRHLDSVNSDSLCFAEDIFAEAFVQFGEFEPALQHCQSSIEILEKLFDSSSIVIGNELIKLASIQLSLGDRSAALHTIKQIEEIFSLYYGSHLVDVCPYVVSLREIIGLD
ncbi:hypothetical protein J5N97_023106 [Dioscorea zingiberensis]|uniref:SET domain-containing protein n=1 Tax=Dioscorea zingiberensis TaxID=325984 RepID=A0A9D5CC08_9LILI|nr:hypothetical protein J5N97_023106 [Dioscorea zingiberensis]